MKIHAIVYIYSIVVTVIILLYRKYTVLQIDQSFIFKKNYV